MRVLLAGGIWLVVLVGTVLAEPASVDSRLVIELVAREPEIVTPTGLAVDERGRVWVIENNTHERPANYQGAVSDRIRIFSEYDDHGRARQVSTFAEGYKNAMSLALGKNGAVYFATRAEIYLLRDTNGDDVADEQKVIVRLDTPGRYPHNGLSGFALDALGDVYFSLGENLGASYKLSGADGTTLGGGGEGGSIYRCHPDGTGLARVATGFWNTFHLTFDAFGRLFAVDNDPDARGPCRLLHIVAGGDYGYRFRNGRKGLHPFTAWNGELPGTLPMVAGTAEAPSGIVAYESTGLPPDYRGQLLVTSWGDHVVERFPLAPHGASLSAQARTLVRGGDDFRPVAIAVAPDGALYLSDWVDRSYPVHGKGRIWRLRMKQPPRDDGLRVSRVAGLEGDKLKPLLSHPRQEIRGAAADALARKGTASKEILAIALQDKTEPRGRCHALWAAAQLPGAEALELLLRALDDPEPAVRAEAARLLGELLPSDGEKRDEARLLALATKDPVAAVRLQAMLQLRTTSSLKALLPVLVDLDPFLVGAALEALGRPGNAALLVSALGTEDARLRLGILLALRRSGAAAGRAELPRFLADPEPLVRRAAIQWVGEEQRRELEPLLAAAVARPPVTREMFEAYLAASDFLAGATRKPGDEPSGELFVAKVVEDATQPPAIRALALRMLRPDYPGLRANRLEEFLNGKDRQLRWEAARTLAMRPDEPSQELLLRLAADKDAELNLRAEAVLGLALSAAGSPRTQRVLVSLLTQPELPREALRSLREAAPKPEIEQALFSWWDTAAGTAASEEGRELAAQLLLALRSNKSAESQKRLKTLEAKAGPRPMNEAEWRAVLAGSGDAAAGERVFFHPHGPRCYSCHRIDGRGASIGPELSKIGRATPCDKLIDSILSPSKEIAPLFVSWRIVTQNGKERTGVIVDIGPHSTLTIADAQGKLEVIKRQDIEERHALATSIMPDKLHDLMTPREFRDLLAFLMELK